MKKASRFVSIILASLILISTSAMATSHKTQKPTVKPKQLVTKRPFGESHFQLCQRLAQRIQHLKRIVRDKNKTYGLKKLISYSAGLNVTTSIYLKLNCKPMKILAPIFESYEDKTKK